MKSRPLVALALAVTLALPVGQANADPELKIPDFSHLRNKAVDSVDMTIDGFLLRIARCPRCGQLFAVRTEPKARNNFTSSCMNCGLKLDGSNAGEAS